MGPATTAGGVPGSEVKAWDARLHDWPPRSCLGYSSHIGSPVLPQKARLGDGRRAARCVCKRETAQAVNLHTLLSLSGSHKGMNVNYSAEGPFTAFTQYVAGTSWPELRESFKNAGGRGR